MEPLGRASEHCREGCSPYNRLRRLLLVIERNCFCVATGSGTLQTKGCGVLVRRGSVPLTEAALCEGRISAQVVLLFENPVVCVIFTIVTEKTHTIQNRFFTLRRNS